MSDNCPYSHMLFTFVYNEKLCEENIAQQKSIKNTNAYTCNSNPNLNKDKIGPKNISLPSIAQQKSIKNANTHSNNSSPKLKPNLNKDQIGPKNILLPSINDWFRS